MSLQKGILRSVRLCMPRSYIKPFIVSPVEFSQNLSKRYLSSGRADVSTNMKPKFSDGEFSVISGISLMHLFNAIEGAELPEIDEIESKDGVLLFSIKPRHSSISSSFVINRHFVTQQLWLASPISGASYFSPSLLSLAKRVARKQKDIYDEPTFNINGEEILWQTNQEVNLLSLLNEEIFSLTVKNGMLKWQQVCEHRKEKNAMKKLAWEKKRQRTERDLKRLRKGIDLGIIKKNSISKTKEKEYNKILEQVWIEDEPKKKDAIDDTFSDEELNDDYTAWRDRNVFNKDTKESTSNITSVSENNSDDSDDYSNNKKKSLVSNNIDDILDISVTSNNNINESSNLKKSLKFEEISKDVNSLDEVSQDEYLECDKIETHSYDTLSTKNNKDNSIKSPRLIGYKKKLGAKERRAMKKGIPLPEVKKLKKRNQPNLFKYHGLI